MGFFPVFEPLNDEQIEEINVILDGCFMECQDYKAVCMADQTLKDRYGKNNLLYFYWCMSQDKRVKYTW